MGIETISNINNISDLAVVEETKADSNSECTEN